MEDAGPIRVLIVDGQPLFREAVTAVIDNESDLDVVGVLGDGSEVDEIATRAQPDIALDDANVLDLTGPDTIVTIRDRAPRCRVLVVADDDDGEVLLRAVEAGARGFLTRGSPLHELLSAVRAVQRGDALIPGRLLDGLLAKLLRRHGEWDRAFRMVSRLTVREREVLAELAAGSDNETIAEHLLMSPQTARTHVQNIRAKLNLHSRLEAAAFVHRTGVLDDLLEFDKQPG